MIEDIQKEVLAWCEDAADKEFIDDLIDYLANRGYLPVWNEDMEAAPRDGTRILININTNSYIVRWSDKAEYGQFEEEPGWQLFECEDGYYSIAFDPDEPQAWMPLPPKEGE